jgi:hypothetical protein
VVPDDDDRLAERDEHELLAALGEVAGEARLSRRDWMGVYDPDAFDLANAVLSGFKLRG